MPKIRRIERNDMSFNVDERYNRPHWERFQSGVWEPETIFVVDEVVEPGSIVVDIGAWVGPVTLYAAHIAGSVYSFEPDPVAFERLSSNVALNPELSTKIHLKNYAIGDRSGDVELFSASFGGSASSVFSEKDHKTEGELGVKKRDKKTIVKMLDATQLLEIVDFRAVSLIKLDAEGAEFMILPRMKQIIQEFKPTVWLSLHPRSVRGYGSDFLDRLKKMEMLAVSLQVFEGYAVFLPIEGRLHEVSASDWLNNSLSLIQDPMRSLKGDPVLFKYIK